MVGQKVLLDKINSLSLSSFPNTLLLLGEKGSGKHLISSYIANKFNLPLVDITNIIDDDVINNIYLNPNPTFYLIDLSLCDSKKQNLMLKFLEEPAKNTFILLLSETKNNLLDTIVNRTIIYSLDKYSDDELLEFTDDKDIIKVLRTPGKLLTSRDNIKDIQELVDNIFNNLHKANFANMLTLPDKFNYSDEYDKFDINIFIDVFLFKLFEFYKENKETKALNMYLLLDSERKKLYDLRINKKIFMQHLFIKLWQLVRENG